MFVSTGCLAADISTPVGCMTPGDWEKENNWEVGDKVQYSTIDRIYRIVSHREIYRYRNVGHDFSQAIRDWSILLWRERIGVTIRLVIRVSTGFVEACFFRLYSSDI